MLWKLATENEEVEFNYVRFTWISDNLTAIIIISEKSSIKPHSTTMDMENWMSSLSHLCEASHFLFSVLIYPSSFAPEDYNYLLSLNRSEKAYVFQNQEAHYTVVYIPQKVNSSKHKLKLADPVSNTYY